ncbi:MAG: polyketide cyclase, partial [Gammaproteobacteria bacterium]
MNRSILHQPDPKLDLVFERIVDVSREPIWTAWTTPAQ